MLSNYPPNFNPDDHIYADDPEWLEPEESDDKVPLSVWLEGVIWGGVDNVPLDTRRRLTNQ